MVDKFQAVTFVPGDVLLKDKVQSLILQGHKNILLDLSGVSYVDSAGLGELVQAAPPALPLVGGLGRDVEVGVDAGLPERLHVGFSGRGVAAGAAAAGGAPRAGACGSRRRSSIRRPRAGRRGP